MPKVGSKADRVALSLIALLQLGVSSPLIFIQFMAYGGGFQPVSTPFLLFGFVNSFFLFTTRPIPRIGSFLWQLIFVTWILVSLFRYPIDFSNPNNRFLYRVSALMVICLIYLGACIRQELATRGWNWSAWLGWE